MAGQAGLQARAVEGLWFLGEQGALTVELLARELFSRLRIRAEQHFGRSFAEYQPWMSNPDRLDEFTELATRPEPLPPVLTDPSVFAVMRRAYRAPSGEPLGGLFSDGEWPLDFFEGTPEANLGIEAGFLRAREQVRSVSAAFDRRFEVLNHTIVPVRILRGVSTGRLGFSSHQLRGAMFFEVRDGSRAFWEVALEVDMAHELGHAALMVYQATDTLLESDVAAPIYSPIRKATRPAIMSFHAVSVLGFIVEFLESALRARRYQGAARQFAESELLGQRADLRRGLQALRGCQFTRVGQLIHDELLALSDGALLI